MHRPSHRPSRLRLGATALALIVCSLSAAAGIPDGPPADAATPDADAYAPLAWLIGTWRGTFVPPDAPAPPEMTFAWSEGRTHLRYRSMMPNGGLEYEGMIAWHPVERRFVFLKVYASSPRPLIENGWIEILPNGAARFHMHTHYAPGIGLPWSGGARAGAEGTTLRFRRTLVSDGPQRLRDNFVMQVEDRWAHPDFGIEVPTEGFGWRRVEAGTGRGV